MRLALGTLTLLEGVLGIDNIIFLSLVVAKASTAQRNRAAAGWRRRGHARRCWRQSRTGHSAD